ncbi:hypothetical protein, partial [Micromonospora echinospora]
EKDHEDEHHEGCPLPLSGACLYGACGQGGCHHASEADSGVPAAAEPAAEARDETAPAADTNPAQDGSDGPAPGEPAPDQR